MTGKGRIRRWLTIVGGTLVLLAIATETYGPAAAILHFVAFVQQNVIDQKSRTYDLLCKWFIAQVWAEQAGQFLARVGREWL